VKTKCSETKEIRHQVFKFNKDLNHKKYRKKEKKEREKSREEKKCLSTVFPM